MSITWSGMFGRLRPTHLYLQMMSDFPQSQTWLYDQFISKGYHTVRQSGCFGAGIWADLAIEQIMHIVLRLRTVRILCNFFLL